MANRERTGRTDSKSQVPFLLLIAELKSRRKFSTVFSKKKIH